jgi:hypothetical protein
MSATCLGDAHLGNLLAERRAALGALDRHLERGLGDADRPHAVMDAAGSEATLGDLEAAALTEEDRRLGHAHVVVHDLGVTVRGIVVAEHVQHLHDLDARGVARHHDTVAGEHFRVAGVGRGEVDRLRT